MNNSVKRVLALVVLLASMVFLFYDITDLWNRQNLRTVKAEASIEILEVTHKLYGLIPMGKDHYYLVLEDREDYIAGYIVRASKKRMEKYFTSNGRAVTEGGIQLTATTKRLDSDYSGKINASVKNVQNTLQESGISLQMELSTNRYLRLEYKRNAIIKLITLILILTEIVIGVIVAKGQRLKGTLFIKVYSVAVVITTVLFLICIMISS